MVNEATETVMTAIKFKLPKRGKAKKQLSEAYADALSLRPGGFSISRIIRTGAVHEVVLAPGYRGGMSLEEFTARLTT